MTDRGGEGFQGPGVAPSALPKAPSTVVAAASPPPPPPTDSRTTSSGRNSLLAKEVAEKERKGGRLQRSGADAGTGSEPVTRSGRAAAAAATVSEAEEDVEVPQQSVREEREEKEDVSPNRVAARQLVQSFLASRYSTRSLASFYSSACAPAVLLRSEQGGEYCILRLSLGRDRPRWRATFFRNQF